MIVSIIFALLVTALLGVLIGIGLDTASRAFAVKKDERVDQVAEALPGINCGACGFPGCAGYAEAVVAGTAELNLCSPGGASVTTAIGTILGQEVQVNDEKMVAQVHCRGGVDVSEYAFEYQGLSDCNAAFNLFGGDKVCKQGCLGFGSCMKVCPTDAIYYDDEGKVWIDKDACISCGKCIDICPSKVIKYVPYNADYIVACNNTEPGGAVRKHCKVGCIGCKLCERKSENAGFAVESNLARINYQLKGDREAAAKACPTSTIVPPGDPIGAQRALKEKLAQKKREAEAKKQEPAVSKD